MSVDDEVRGYERALLRAGQDPREVAASLLGADPKRFLLIIGWQGEASERLRPVLDAELPERAWATCRKVTGWTRTSTGESAAPLWAFAPVSLAELVDWSAPFMARNQTVRIWDGQAQKQVTFYGAATLDRISEGWPEALPTAQTLRSHSYAMTYVDVEGNEVVFTQRVPSNIVVDRSFILDSDAAARPEPPPV